MRYSTGILTARVKPPPENTIRNCRGGKATRFALLGFRGDLFLRRELFGIRAASVLSILSSADDDIIPNWPPVAGAAFLLGYVRLTRRMRLALRIIVTGTGTSNEEILRAICRLARRVYDSRGVQPPANSSTRSREVHSGSSVWAPKAGAFGRAVSIERATASPRRGAA